jgi:hypothetical protein
LRAVEWKEHADEAVEDFPVVNVFYCVLFLSFLRDSATGGSQHFSPWAMKSSFFSPALTEAVH